MRIFALLIFTTGIFGVLVSTLDVPGPLGPIWENMVIGLVTFTGGMAVGTEMWRKIERADP